MPQPSVPSWPERFGLRLARQMDSLSTKLSDSLGVWSKLDTFSGITLAKLGAVVCAAMIAVALFLLIRRGLSRHRASGTAPVHAVRNGVLLSARKTLIWITPGIRVILVSDSSGSAFGPAELATIRFRPGRQTRRARVLFLGALFRVA